MRIKQNIFSIWGSLHLIFVFLICADSAYVKYCRFYNIPQNVIKQKAGNMLLYNTPLLVYGKLTGTGVGYGFFAPNVKSSGLFIGDCDGQQIMPKFNSFESAMRFSTLSSTISDDMFIQTSANDTTKALIDKCSDAIYKAIAVKMYNQNNCVQDTLYLSYNIIMFPTLKQYASGMHDYSLFKTKELRIIKKAND